jgi:AraC family transcriptional activator of tynA and feaB
VPVVQTWSTSPSAPADQFTHWRELICAAFLALTPESDVRGGFTGVVTQWSLGALSLARIDSQRQRVQRTGRDIARAPRPGFYANLQVRGTSLMTQHGRTAFLRPGDLAVVDTGEPFAFDFPADFRQLSFFIPAGLLTAQVCGPVRTATRVDSATGVGAAVRHTLGALTRDALPSAQAARLAAHASGLLALALDPVMTGPITTGPVIQGGPRRARWLAAAVADIEEHLVDDDLSPAATARRLGISVRTLHAVFAGHDRSYAATVRRFRLTHAWRALQDPARRQLRVIDVAADAGFANAAAFHRAFRREFGRTPAQLRPDAVTR